MKSASRWFNYTDCSEASANCYQTARPNIRDDSDIPQKKRSVFVTLPINLRCFLVPLNKAGNACIT
jgi:hypothetical protein